MSDEWHDMVSMWLINDEGSYTGLVEILEREKDNESAGEMLREYVESILPKGEFGLYGDIKARVLGYVDWESLAEDNREG